VRPAQAIVILGARVDSQGQPGDSLRARTLQAVELFKQGAAPVIICSGGIGERAPSEAAAAARLAIEHGVPVQAIVLEEQSRTTRENCRNTAAICRARGWTRVIAVSDPYHLWRVRRGLEREGIVAATSPARSSRRNRRALSRIAWTAREALAIARDLVAELLGR
jgi:uncharacterized SAM-binding protein YcdF (DUF218 family)